MKSTILIVALIASCQSWRHNRNLERWEYQPTYTDDCKSTADLVVDGTYQGKNLYCQNPYVNCIDSTSRFVTVNVTINDTIQMPSDSIASGAFEIPLMDYGFKINDPVHIVITHYLSGNPRILNPEVR